jgi:hypothetical protein
LSIETSKYQLCDFEVRASIRSIARGENETGDSPGGQERHFWVPE